MATVWKLFALLALVLMPSGMSSASAAPMHDAPQASTAGHCDGHGSAPEKAADRSADCAIACSMLLMAGTSLPEPLLPEALASPAAPDRNFTGHHPDTLTPPPKFS